MIQAEQQYCQYCSGNAQQLAFLQTMRRKGEDNIVFSFFHGDASHAAIDFIALYRFSIDGDRPSFIVRNGQNGKAIFLSRQCCKCLVSFGTCVAALHFFIPDQGRDFFIVLSMADHFLGDL